MIKIPININWPEMEMLTKDQKSMIIQECWEMEELQILRKKHGPEPFRFAALITIPFIGILIFLGYTEIWKLLLLGSIIFIVVVPVVFYLNLSKQRKLFKKLVKNRVAENKNS